MREDKGGNRRRSAVGEEVKGISGYAMLGKGAFLVAGIPDADATKSSPGKQNTHPTLITCDALFTKSTSNQGVIKEKIVN